MPIVPGKVTSQFIALLKSVTFKPGVDEFGTFEQVNQGITFESCPMIGALNRWGALPKSMGGVLTITEATKMAIANGTAMSNGNFIDSSDAFQLGNTKVYQLCIDATGAHAVAFPVV